MLKTTSQIADLLTMPLAASPSLDETHSLEKHPKLLLVEDNKIALFTLENLISQAGFQFISVMDGESALRLIQTQLFDLIITDLGLPGLSGIELTCQVREFEKTKMRAPVPIIGLTAHSEEEIKRGCLQAGMNEVYTKPMTMEVLSKIKSSYFRTNSKTIQQNNDTEEPSLFGPDLPSSEEELFALDTFALFNAQSGLEAMGNNVNLLRGVLKTIIEKEIPADLVELEKAHANNDWDTIEKVAHRMKSGFIYCGAEKLVHACQYLERYQKAGHTSLLERLYQQMLVVVAETKNTVKSWLLINEKN